PRVRQTRGHHPVPQVKLLTGIILGRGLFEIMLRRRGTGEPPVPRKVMA
ncbi:MAG: hypothetical protein V7603_186, partial [Micromonosporaceae bacterium]